MSRASCKSQRRVPVHDWTPPVCVWLCGVQVGRVSGWYVPRVQSTRGTFVIQLTYKIFIYMNSEERVTYFAYTDSRNKRTPFGIKAKDRTRHVYVIGKTGMGKSTLLENMAVQDIKNGEGFAFIDPHGKTAELLLEYIPESRAQDVVYFAPFDMEYPISFNVLEKVDQDKRHLVVAGLMSTFKKIWQDAWSARMEYILTNTLLALLEFPGATLLGVNRMLSDKAYRDQVLLHVKDPSVRSFWVDEFANYTERMAAEAVPAIQNKIGQFTANALIRNMIGQERSSFDIRALMDNRKILIINLSKGRIGESNANLLGGMLITKIYLAAMSRADVGDRILKTLPNFYLFVDEFQNFANESFADILSEARKYKLNLTVAHQYIEQMEEEVRAAVFGNVGTMVAFRVGAFDAEVLEKEFAPQFTAEDMVNLGFAQVYLKLMIDGISSQPFSAVTMEPIVLPQDSAVEKVITASRAQFARSRASVEQLIEEWHKPLPGSEDKKSKPKGVKPFDKAPRPQTAQQSHPQQSSRPVSQSVPQSKPLVHAAPIKSVSTTVATPSVSSVSVMPVSQSVQQQSVQQRTLPQNQPRPHPQSHPHSQVSSQPQAQPHAPKPVRPDIETNTQDGFASLKDMLSSLTKNNDKNSNKNKEPLSQKALEHNLHATHNAQHAVHHSNQGTHRPHDSMAVRPASPMPKIVLKPKEGHKPAATVVPSVAPQSTHKPAPEAHQETSHKKEVPHEVLASVLKVE